MKKRFNALLLSALTVACGKGESGGGDQFVVDFPNGQTKTRGYRLEDGTAVGLLTEYFPNANKRFEGRVAGRKKEGSWKYWYESGQLKEESSYSDGELHGSMTAWHSNGQIETAGSFSEGKAVGLAERWHSNGERWSRSEFVDSQLHGEHLSWDSDGYHIWSECGIYEFGEKVAEHPSRRDSEHKEWLRKSNGTLFEGMSLDDLPRIELFMELTGRWNEVSAPIVLQYLDPEVAAEDWVEAAKPVLGEMREILVLMKSEALLFPKCRYRDTCLSPLVESQGRKLDAFTRLHGSVSNMDEESELAAQATIQEIAAEQSVLISKMFDELRSTGLMSPYVEEVVRDRAEKNARLLNPR